MSLTNQPPRQRRAKKQPDKAYMENVTFLPCCICEAFGEVQKSRSEAHHPICERYENERVPDPECIPLCDGHHTARNDKSKLAIHRGKATWVAAYGSDRDYIAATQDKIARAFNGNAY